jgi:outer membrane biosynthesis protein TonB
MFCVLDADKKSGSGSGRGSDSDDSGEDEEDEAPKKVEKKPKKEVKAAPKDKSPKEKAVKRKAESSDKPEKKKRAKKDKAAPKGAKSAYAVFMQEVASITTIIHPHKRAHSPPPACVRSVEPISNSLIRRPPSQTWPDSCRMRGSSCRLKRKPCSRRWRRPTKKGISPPPIDSV